MPLHYARRVTGRDRTPEGDRRLGLILAFVAGAINAGGFLAVQQYTSHMTGLISAAADHLVLGHVEIVLSAFGGFVSFLAGSTTAAMLVSFARRRRAHSEFAFPLLLEAGLLLLFGLLGASLAQVEGLFVPLTVMLLCFIMGIQNAVTSMLPSGQIRTTHLTGHVTDIGVELGKLLYWNRHDRQMARIVANRPRLVSLILLVLLFFAGGVIGALGFQSVGYLATVPIAGVLAWLAGVPAIDDLIQTVRQRLGRASPSKGGSDP